MTLKKFRELNNDYRVICEWDNTLEICDKNSMFIPCWSNKGMIYWTNGKKMNLLIFCSPTTVLDEIKSKENIELEAFGECGEYTVEFDEELIHVICKYFKAKAQAKRPVPPHSNRNITTYLRVMSNVSEKYKEMLDEYIKKNRQ